ncbi:MAG: glycosidase, partial [Chthoniobacterales bacterium]
MKNHPTGVLLQPDNKRVVVRPFISIDPTRVGHIIARALALSEAETHQQLALVRADFSERHIDLDKSWLRHFDKVRGQVPDSETISEARRLFIGALFSGEYALESAALFNPSIVPHPDQTGLSQGDLRFVLSLRATGEGHISSIQFRTGVIHRDHSVQVEKTTPFVTLPELDSNPTYHKRTFLDKLNEMGLEND